MTYDIDRLERDKRQAFMDYVNGIGENTKAAYEKWQRLSSAYGVAKRGLGPNPAPWFVEQVEETLKPYREEGTKS